MNLQHVFCYLILSLLSNSSFGQKDFTVSSNFHYGFMIPHHSSIVNLIQGHSKAIEVNLNWTTDGSKLWHAEENYPNIGIDFFASNLGNNKHLGNQLSVMGYLDFPIGEKKHHYFKTGAGIGYTSKIWDIENNIKGMTLSSHFNAAVLLQYSYHIPLSEFLKLKTGLRITHFSNGSLKLPNKGTNNATCFLGLTFGREDEPISHQEVVNQRLDNYANKKFHFSTTLATGLKQMTISDNKRYSTFSFATILDKRISAKTSWGIGLDVFYNSGLRNVLKLDNQTQYSRIYVSQMGGIISYTKHLFPWEIKLMLGAYIKDNYKLDGRIYNRFGLRYFFNDHLFTGVSLKIHQTTADFGTLGIGWRF